MAISRDSSASGGAVATTTTSYTHTVGSGLTNSIAIVIPAIVGGSGTRGITQVKFGSTDITSNTLVTANLHSTFLGAYYMFNPPSGAQTVSYTISGAGLDLVCVSVVYAGVDSTQPDASTSGGGFTYSVTPNANQSWMIAAYADNASQTPSYSSGGIGLQNRATGNSELVLADSNAALTGGVSHNIVFTGSGQASNNGIAFTLAPLKDQISFRTLLGVGA